MKSVITTHRFEAAQKRRKSKSIGTKLEGDDMLKVRWFCQPFRNDGH